MTNAPKPTATPKPSAAPSHHAAVHKSFKAFQVEGDFQMGRVRQHFVIQVAAPDEQGAKDRVLATLGSRHGVNRRQVAIAGSKALQGDDVTDALVRHELGLTAH
jgi:ribosomal protein L20A (L18A)